MTCTAMETFLCRAICSLFIFYSLITWRAQCSRSLNSAVTPSCKRWSASRGSATKFSPTPFKTLIVGLSASFSVVSDPSSSTNAMEAFMHSISVAFYVPIAKLVDSIPACNVQVFNSYSLVWMAPRMTYCCFLNFCRTSEVTYLIVSSMSYKSSFVNVIRSSEVLVAQDLFMDPPFSSPLGCLMQPDVS